MTATRYLGRHSLRNVDPAFDDVDAYHARDLDMAIAIEREAAALVRILIPELAKQVDRGNIWNWGDGNGGGLQNMLHDAFSARGMDLFGRDEPKPDPPRKLTADERAAIYQRDGRVCRWCGETRDLSIDHIHPVSYGGTNDPENLQVLCRSCNSWKSNRRADR